MSGRGAGRRPAGRRSWVVAAVVSLACHGVAVAAGILVVLAVRVGAVDERSGEDGRAESSLRGPDAPAAAWPAPSLAALAPTDRSAEPPAPVPEPDGTEAVPPSLPFPPPLIAIGAEEDVTDPAPTLAAFRATESLPTFPKPRLQFPPADAAAVPAAAGGAAGDPTQPPGTPAATVTPAAGPAVVPETGVRVAGGRRRPGFDDRGLPIPDYPPESKRRREQGLVEVEVEVLADGRVGDARVLSDGGHPRLADAAVAAVRRAEFEPATRGGRPVAGRLIVPFRFVLK